MNHSSNATHTSCPWKEPSKKRNQNFVIFCVSKREKDQNLRFLGFMLPHLCNRLLFRFDSKRSSFKGRGDFFQSSSLGTFTSTIMMKINRFELAPSLCIVAHMKLIKRIATYPQFLLSAEKIKGMYSRFQYFFKHRK